MYLKNKGNPTMAVKPGLYGERASIKHKLCKGLGAEVNGKKIV